MPKGDAKEGYLNTNAHLEAKVAMLMAQLAESQAREAKLRELLTPEQYKFGKVPPFGDLTALREMIEAAKAEEREACAALVEQRSARSRTVRAAINDRQPEPCQYAEAIRAR